MPGKHVHFSEDVSFPPTPSPTFSSNSLPSSYGPLTPPPFNSNQYLPANGVPMIHPTLAPATPMPYLLFDVTLPAENVKPSPNARLSQGIIFEAATSPPLPSILVVHPQIPRWPIIITPSEGKYVRVCDVLAGIYKSLRTSAGEADFQALPASAQAEVTAAFKRRFQRMPDPASMKLENKKGLKWVDFLGSAVRFVGLSKAAEGPNVWQLHLST
ncbi:hypothetical protein B0H10DRAFT_1780465 [Mycena sp. CBHHK59/15]|nr:hypothetical protein B0H10DRAFT_1780465 [Mycena sp. CBHHK59/15]